MKKVFVVVFLLAGLSSAYCQDTNMDLTIRFNSVQQRYEVYAKPATSRSYNLGPSQISIVFPAAVADQALTFGNNNLTSVNGGTWSDNSRIYAPSNTPAVDYHGFGSTGSPINLVAGQDLLMFHFTLSGGCIAGLRIFENGVDPASNASANMNGSDFGNTFPDANFIDHYNSVYANTGTSCTVECNVSAPQLSLE
ncbi:hypothetical protein SAMN06298216_1015 [Spirosomataceae bacterium TFI 002]|nr:hypothetical protein SAMN06298216_1015 [Spirosomataceae bacterium TFI 002]